MKLKISKIMLESSHLFCPKAEFVATVKSPTGETAKIIVMPMRID